MLAQDRWTIKRGFDVVDGALEDLFSNPIQFQYPFRREPLTTGSIKYTIILETLDELTRGQNMWKARNVTTELTIRKLDRENTEIAVTSSMLPFSYREHIEEYDSWENLRYRIIKTIKRHLRNRNVRKPKNTKSRAPKSDLVTRLKNDPAESAADSPVNSNDGMAHSSTGSNVTNDSNGRVELPNVTQMREFYPDYSLKTANDILDQLKAAHDIFENEGGHWGPGKIAKVIPLKSVTIGRYLKAFRQAGLTEWKGVPLPK